MVFWGVFVSLAGVMIDGVAVDEGLQATSRRMTRINRPIFLVYIFFSLLGFLKLTVVNIRVTTSPIKRI